MALNSDVHRNLRFAPNETNFSFVRDTTAVLLAGVEFAEAGREYPIVFIRGQDKQMRPRSKGVSFAFNFPKSCHVALLIA